MDLVPRIEAERVAHALQAILQSRTFSRSERLRSFLKFVVEMEQQGQADRLKGYTIGIDVFGRDDGFDPTTDPLVRVQAGKLRRLLTQFYADEGQTEPLRIHIPVGAYVPFYELAGSANAYGNGSSSPFDPLPSARSLPSSPAPFSPISVKELPTVFYRVADGSDWRAQAYANAVGLWSNRLWGVHLKTLEDLHAGGRALDPFYFVLDVATTGSEANLTSTLRHVVSGDSVFEQNGSIDTTSDILQLGALANQFVGSALTIPGHLYQFCHQRNLSSPLMLCLDATYRFTVEATQESYREARLHQNRIDGMPKKAGLVLKIPELMALTRPRG